MHYWCVCVYVCTMVYVWRLEDNCGYVGLSFDCRFHRSSSDHQAFLAGTFTLIKTHRINWVCLMLLLVPMSLLAKVVLLSSH